MKHPPLIMYPALNKAMCFFCKILFLVTPASYYTLLLKKHFERMHEGKEDRVVGLAPSAININVPLVQHKDQSPYTLGDMKQGQDPLCVLYRR